MHNYKVEKRYKQIPLILLIMVVLFFIGMVIYDLMLV